MLTKHTCLMLAVPLLVAAALFFAVGQVRNSQGMMPEVVVRPVPADALPEVLVIAPAPGSEPTDSGRTLKLSSVSIPSKGAIR